MQNWQVLHIESYSKDGGRIGSKSINIYVGYMQANVGTQSMKYKPRYIHKNTPYSIQNANTSSHVHSHNLLRLPSCEHSVLGICHM